MNQGWQCPLCKTVYAPHVDKCECAAGERTFDFSADNSDEPNRVNQAGDPHKELREFLEEMRELMERSNRTVIIPAQPIPDYLKPPFKITCEEPVEADGRVDKIRWRLVPTPITSGTISSSSGKTDEWIWHS